MSLEIRDFQMNYLEDKFFKLKVYRQIFHINMHAKYDPERSWFGKESFRYAIEIILRVNIAWRSMFLYRIRGIADFYALVPIYYIKYLKSKLEIDNGDMSLIMLNKINNDKIGSEYFAEFVAQVRNIP